MSEHVKSAVQQLKQAIEADPSAAKIVFRATTTSRADDLTTGSSIRGFQIRNDEPPELGGTDTGPNPVEAVLAALGSCQAIVYRAYASALGIRIDSVDVEARGQLDVRGFLGDPSVAPGFQRVDFSVRVSSPEPAERIGKLAALVDRHCPVLDILRTPVAVAATFEHVAPRAARDAA